MVTGVAAPGIATSAIGLHLKSSKVTSFNTLMEYIETRSEVRKLLKDEHAIIKDDKKLHDQVKKHNIEKIDKIMADVNDKSREFSLKVHKTLIHDFLAIKRLKKLLNATIADLKKLRDELKRANRPPKEIREVEKEIAMLEALSKREGGNLLADVRKVLNGLFNLVEGKMDIAMFVKKHFFMDIYLINYIRMRRETRGVKRGLLDAKKRWGQIAKHHGEISRSLQEFKSGNIKKTAEKLAGGEKATKKDVLDFSKVVSKAFHVILHLFSDTCLLVEKVIRILREQRTEDIKLAQEHEIPLALAKKDEVTKGDVLEHYFRPSIHAVWNVARQAA